MNGDGYIWVATESGLSRLDRNTHLMTRYKHDVNNRNSLGGSIVRNLLFDSKNQLWVGTYNGLDKYDFVLDSFIHYQHDANDITSISDNLIYSIIETADGTLWVGTNHGLNSYDRQQNNFSHLFHDSNNINSLTGNAIHAIHEDSKHRLWIGTAKGLNLLNRVTGEFSRYQENQDTPNTLSNNYVASIESDNKNQLWLSTGSGLNVFDITNEHFSHYVNDPFESNSISGSFVTSLFKDDTQNMWIATYPEGVSYISHLNDGFTTYKPRNNKNGLSHRSVTSFYEENTGELWIGTDGGGLNLFDREKNEFISYQHDSSNPNSLAAQSVLTITKNNDNNLWIGMWGTGLDIFHPNNQSFIHYSTSADGSMPNSNNIMSVFKDSYDNMWLGTNNGGINRYEKKSQQFFYYQPIDGNEHSFSSNFNWTIFEDSKQDLWFGTGNGLDKYDRALDQFIHYRFDINNPQSLSNNTVLAITEGIDGNLWIGTRGGGLNKFNRESGVFTTYNIEHGIPDNAIVGILSDNNGDLWLSTLNGLCRFKIHLNRCQAFDKRLGLQGNRYNIGAALKLKSGQLAFGGTQGFTLIEPNKIMQKSPPPRIVLTGIKIANKPVSQHDINSPLVKNISQTTSLTLNHLQSMFSFEFSTLDYLNPEQSNYAYQLEGFDKDWLYIDNLRTATYTNLDPGDYVFKVKGANSIGIWNEKGVSIAITILPAPWKTWWAYCLYLLIVGSIISLIVYLQFKKIQERNFHHQATKKREEQLTLALWASRDELWNVNLIDNTIIRQNRLECLQSISTNSWLLPNIDMDHIHPDDKNRIKDTLKSYFAGTVDYFEVAYREKTNSGDWLWLLDRGQITKKDDKGIPLRFSGTTKNIDQLKTTEEELFSLNKELEQRVEIRTTELKQSNEALKSTQEQLVESEKMAALADLVVGVSHELNTPLGVTITSLSVIEDSVEKIKVNMSENKISRNNLSSFIAIVKQSLDLAQVNLRKTSDIVQKFKLVAADSGADELSETYILNALEKSIESTSFYLNEDMVHINLTCSSQLSIMTYPDVLIEVINQLLRNSQTHALIENEKLTININVEKLSDCVVIYFKDDGKGMEQESVTQIFDPFYTTNRGSYSGLGMHIVYNQVCHLLKGRIQCSSTIDRGCLFSIFIPFELALN